VHQRREALARREAGEVLTEIARSYNVSHSTISRRPRVMQPPVHMIESLRVAEQR
jgi:hypothetical protein